MFGKAKSDESSAAHEAASDHDDKNKDSGKKHKPAKPAGGLDIPEAAQPALRLAVFDLIVQTAAMVLKRTAEDRARQEIRQALGKKAAKTFEKRDKFVRGAALSIAGRSVPLAIAVGGIAGGVLWYRYAKKKRDERRDAANNKAQPAEQAKNSSEQPADERENARKQVRSARQSESAKSAAAQA